MSALKDKTNTLLYNLAADLMFKRPTRKYLVRLMEKKVASALEPGKNSQFPKSSKRILREKKLIALSIIQSLVHSIESGNLNRKVAHAIFNLWIDVMAKPRQSNEAVRHFYGENGYYPPWFLVISPGHACNLKCNDCYASSASSDGTKLDWEIMDRLISDAKKIWGIKLVVFSGGEPFIYRSNGKDILDIVKKNPDMLFLAFTNGTVLDRDLTEKIAAYKNLTPAFSVEGLQQATDKRRGAGAFEKVLNAMELMRNAGAPFGISVTVNRENYQDILGDEFLDFFFNIQGAFYGFYFQYLPIGKNSDFNHMPTPGQRLEFWKNIWGVIERKKLFLIDFWNHGTLVKGCISAGRDGGYFYVDWNGSVMPCVFTPYSAGNIIELYNNGKTLEDVWNLPFFASIRKWQAENGHGTCNPKDPGNLLTPCPFRDHHQQFMKWLDEYDPEDEDLPAMEIRKDAEYKQKMVEYSMELHELFDPVWQSEYVKGPDDS